MTKSHHWCLAIAKLFEDNCPLSGGMAGAQGLSGDGRASSQAEAPRQHYGSRSLSGTNLGLILALVQSSSWVDTAHLHLSLWPPPWAWKLAAPLRVPPSVMGAAPGQLQLVFCRVISWVHLHFMPGELVMNERMVLSFPYCVCWFSGVDIVGPGIAHLKFHQKGHENKKPCGTMLGRKTNFPRRKKIQNECC